MTDQPLKLLVLESASIQSYIFGSNRLKENIGASYLVAAATNVWPLETIRNLTDAHNLGPGDTYKKGAHIEDDPSQQVEVLYRGGGNFIALFANDELCSNFCRDLSRRVIVEAPGLHIVFHTADYHWNKAPLSKAVGNALKSLREQRGYQPRQRGIVGLGVTAACRSSNLPAVKLERDPDNNYQLYSAESASKQRAATFANDQLQGQFQLSDNYIFALELDQLGRSKGEQSSIAVVHADGNGLGLLIQGVQDKYNRSSDNRNYIEYMRSFSERIKKINQRCQQAMAEQLLRSIEVDSETGEHTLRGIYDQASIQLPRSNGDVVFPLRPLVSGGDDITFVCDGRIAIDLTVTFLNAFEHHTSELLGDLLKPVNKTRLTACAGIAIVNTHYPFARAYGLADELAGSAKKSRYRLGVDSSAFDWHFTNGGLYGSLADMRRREYQARGGSLTMRPIFTGEDAHPYRTWSQLRRVTTEFQTGWRDNRSKAKELMTALRDGPLETQIYNLRYMRKNNLSLPEFANFHKKYGWDGWDDDEGICGYYDALELMDLYIPLQTGVTVKGKTI